MIKAFFHKFPYIKTVLFFAAVLAGLIYIEVTPQGFLDPDGYYHSTMAQILASGQYLTKFPWISATTWAQSYADQHLLYHVLLIPFAKASPIAGVQIFNALCGTAAAAAFYALIKSLQVRAPKLWTLFFLFASSGFLFRLSLVKATGISLFLMFLFLRFLLNKKLRWLAALSFVFVWVYAGFVFLLPMLALYAAAELLSNYSENQNTSLKGYWIATMETIKRNWLVAACTLGGIILGILLFPHTGNLLRELYDQMFHAGLGYKIPVGSEWYRPAFLQIISGYAFVWVVWLVAALLVIFKSRTYRRNSTVLFFFLLSAFFFALATKSQRFVEYAVPFMVLFAAYTLQPLIPPYSAREILAKIRANPATYSPIIMGGAAIVLVCALQTMLAFKDLHSTVPISQLQGVSNYLINHTEPGEIVFNTRWDNFPQLFFLNRENYYITGMDQMFMYVASQEKYWLWRHIADGDTATCGQPSCTPENSRRLEDVLPRDFNTSHIVLEKNSLTRLYEHLKNNSRFTSVYEDTTTALFKIN
jgi:hypothetical protein